MHLGLVAVSRAPQGSGADYYLQPPGYDRNAEDGLLDLESAVRLEVSGIDNPKHAGELATRLREKAQQAIAGASDSTAYACVVAFSDRRVVFQKAV